MFDIYIYIYIYLQMFFLCLPLPHEKHMRICIEHLCMCISRIFYNISYVFQYPCPSTHIGSLEFDCIYFLYFFIIPPSYPLMGVYMGGGAYELLEGNFDMFSNGLHLRILCGYWDMGIGKYKKYNKICTYA